jgi:hypothetical protein
MSLRDTITRYEWTRTWTKKRLDGRAVWQVARLVVGRKRQVAVPLRLRARGRCSNGESEPGEHGELRLCAKHQVVQAGDDSRSVQYAGIQVVAQHTSSLPRAWAPELSAVRRTWHRCVPAVVRKRRGICEGRWASADKRTHARPHRQLTRLRARQCSVGYANGAGSQSVRVPAGHVPGTAISVPERVRGVAGAADRHQAKDAKARVDAASVILPSGHSRAGRA